MPRRPAKTKHPLLADVAREAGVSIAAASYALNGVPGVSDATRARVRDAAAALRYSPNRIATSLVGGQSTVFGLTVPELTNPFSLEMAAGVLRAASAFGYGVFVSELRPGESGGGSLDFLLEHRVAGLVLSSVVDEDRGLLDELLRRNVPVVLAIRRIEGVDVDFVGIDDVAAAELEVDHLVGLGRSDLAFVVGPQNSSAQRARVAGFRAALERAGRGLPAERLVISDLTRRGGYDAVLAILGAELGPPDAILCTNDVMALGVIDALIDHGKRVPEDVAVVGFDDMSLASSRLVELTTVRVPLERLGAAAVDALMRRIGDPNTPTVNIMLPHSLVVRRTCGSPPATIA